MPDNENPEQAVPATTPEPVKIRIAPQVARDLAPVLATLALQCADRRGEIEKLDASRDKAGVYLRTQAGRPADLQMRPLSDYHPDLCLSSAVALDADAGAVICVVFKKHDGEEINFAFEAPARETQMPRDEEVSGRGEQAAPPAPETITITKEEFNQGVRAALSEALAPLAQKIQQLEQAAQEKKPATREEIFAARAAEYEAALHENMLAEVKSRKKVDPDDLLDKMMERQEKFTERMFQSHARVTALAAEHTPPPPEKASLGETNVNEPFKKKGAA
jgi:hypothetical protein